MLERLQKIISAAGIASRRAAEELIAEGRVRVNGRVITELGTRADASKDHIKVDGKLINPQQPPTYIMLNKPAGFVTTMSDPEGRSTVQDLLKGIKTRVYPVGRLDYNTEGLLLLTNDGDFAHLITHPKHEFPKTYLAKVKGMLDERQIETLEKGMFLQDGKTAPAKVKKVRKEEMNSWLEITIHEGRKRQVRRMFDHVGHSVIRLKRIRTGGLSLGDLPEGRFRHLTPEEVNSLRETALKTDDSGRQVRVYKPAEQVAEKRRTAAGDGKKRVPGARVMQDTRSGLRKNQTARSFHEARPETRERSRAAGSGNRFTRSADRQEGPLSSSRRQEPGRNFRKAKDRRGTGFEARRPGGSQDRRTITRGNRSGPGTRAGAGSRKPRR